MYYAFDQFGLFYERNILMVSIRQYLITLISASMLCSIAITFVGNKGAHSTIIKLICGLFVTVCVLSPVIKIEIEDVSSYFATLNADAASISSQGQEHYLDSTAAVIKSQLESYVLEKAAAMNANISVEFVMSSENCLLPESVKLSGSIAPFTKQRIEQFITSDLGIPKENQMWI